MSTHTPGPWVVRVAAGYDVFEVMAHDTLLVAICDNDMEGIPYPVANASLISAAPDLLACLLEVVAQYGPWHDDDCPGDDTCDCGAKPFHDRINAAIAKAEGR